MQAHVPPAIAQLLGRGGDKTGQYKDAFADLLAGKFGKRNNAVYQSAVLALGTLCQSEEIEKGAQPSSDALLKYFSSGMVARLGFTTATEVSPGILLLDESLGAGEAGFA